MFIIGQQTCRVCGALQVSIRPVDVDVLEAECSRCGEMAAEFKTSYPLADHKALEQMMKFSLAKRALAARGRERES